MRRDCSIIEDLAAQNRLAQRRRIAAMALDLANLSGDREDVFKLLLLRYADQ